MTISVRVSKTDVDKVSKKLKDLFERINNPTPVLNDIADYMVRVTVNRLVRSKTAPDGTRWRENSELTQYLKGGRNSPLYNSGALSRSIRVLRQDRNGFFVGSELDYAAYNQFGVQIMKGKYKSKTKPKPQIPARPFLGFSDTNKVKIAKMMREYIKSGADTIPDDAL